MEKRAQSFLTLNKENGNFNQYWYSPKSMAFLAEQAAKSESGCFMSAPSIYFCLDNPKFQKPYYVFDVNYGVYAVGLEIW